MKRNTEFASAAAFVLSCVAKWLLMSIDNTSLAHRNSLKGRETFKPVTETLVD